LRYSETAWHSASLSPARRTLIPRTSRVYRRVQRELVMPCASVWDTAGRGRSAAQPSFRFRLVLSSQPFQFQAPVHHLLDDLLTFRR
jgi:hypothetical protein